MNLIVEQGNTLTKTAVYDGGQLIATHTHKVLGVAELQLLFEQYPLTQGILSSVTHTEADVLSFLQERLSFFLRLDATTPLPIQLGYQTPETLGRDRIAAAVGAHWLQPGRNLLVIDAGTAITYEVIEASGLYVGGNISPGMTTRFRALNAFTERLPLCDEEPPFPFIGVTTQSAIQAGVVHGIRYEMEGYIAELQAKYPDLLVFLTGGHTFYFAGRLKKAIFADVNLVLTGLNRILEYNVEN